MKLPFDARIARLNLLSTTLIVAVFAACTVSLFYVSQNKHIATHVEYLRTSLIQGKRDFVKNIVYRTVAEIDNERLRCREQLQDGGKSLPGDAYKQLELYCSKEAIQERLADRIRNTYLINDGYIWVNEVLDYGGGDGYAIRLVHPNLIETEGSLLTTAAKDLKGNTPYKTELEGVKKSGELFFTYWFKEKSSDTVSEKLTFAKLYKDYNWIIATGVYLDDVEDVVQSQLKTVRPAFNRTLIFVVSFGLLTVFAALFIALFFYKRVRSIIDGHIREVEEKEKAIVTMNENLEDLVLQRTHTLHESEQKLRESEEKYHDLYDNAPDMFASVDAKTGLVRECNQTLCRTLGKSRDEIIGVEIIDLYHPISKKEAQDAFAVFKATGNITDKHMFLQRSDGAQLTVSLNVSAIRNENGDVLYSRSSWRDITDFKKMETELRQAQKMEAIGTLAGGIAHDFNNILATILGYTELSLDDVGQGTELEENLLEVETAGNRAKGLVQQILTFARQTDEEVSPLDITPIVKELVRFVRSSIPTTISVTSSIESTFFVMANPSQIHQILMNLCTNSAHAMGDGGELHLLIRDVRIGAEDPKNGSGIRSGDYLKISVTDSGTGIAPGIVDSIYEPYFTTKEVGKGTGIGLAVVHGIVKKYDGFIEVDSTVGKGTVFDIYLPRASTREVSVNPEYGSVAGGSEHVLVVDDEQPLAKMQAKLLEQYGYRVTVCSDSSEALSIFRNDPSGFAALLTDMTMPGLTGEKLAQACQKIKPELVVIVCTGYSEVATPKSAGELGVHAVVQKPIVGTDLAKVLREGLDS